MPQHFEKRVLPYTREQIFELVADIEKYNEFLPWCLASRYKGREGDNIVVAELVIGFKMFRERFVSKVTLDAPRTIHVDYLQGPMKRLNNEWVFKDGPEEGTCEVEFHVDFEFKNIVLQKLVGVLFAEAFRRMLAAFEARAKELYG